MSWEFIRIFTVAGFSAFFAHQLDANILPAIVENLYLYILLAPILILLAMFTVVTLEARLFSTSKFATDEDREWLARAGGFFLRAVLLWLILVFVTLFVPALFSDTFNPAYLIGIKARPPLGALLIHPRIRELFQYIAPNAGVISALASALMLGSSSKTNG